MSLHVVYIESDSELSKVLTDLGRGNVVGVDTETTGLDPLREKVRLVQLAIPGTVYVVDCFRVTDMEPLRRLLESPDQVKVFQNAKFDIKMLGRNYGIFPRPIFDTMVADILLDREAGHGLADITGRVLGESMSKEEQTSDWTAPELRPEQIEYAARDAETLIRLYLILNKRLNDGGLAALAELEFAVVSVTARMELNGFQLDKASWSAELEKVSHERKALGDFLAGELGTNVLRSPKKLAEALRSRGIPLPSQKSTSEGVLKGFAADHPLILEILRWKKLDKLGSTYGVKLLESVSTVTGRVHANFHSAGTVSGRYSSSKPNLQNIPKEHRWRRNFIAPPGRLLVIGDYSQIELRVLAGLSGDGRMLRAYEQRIDLHKFTAAMVTKKKMEEITKPERQLAKAINFGIAYGMSRKGLAQYAFTSYGVQMSEEDAQSHLTLFFEVFNRVRRWQLETIEKTRADGYAKTFMGRMIPLKDSYSSKALNYPVQGTAAEGLKHALVLLDERLVPLDSRIVCTVHDEIVVECPAGSVDAIKKLLHDTMIEGMKRVIPSVPVEVDVRVAPTWSEQDAMGKGNPGP